MIFFSYTKDVTFKFHDSANHCHISFTYFACFTLLLIINFELIPAIAYFHDCANPVNLTHTNFCASHILTTSMAIGS